MLQTLFPLSTNKMHNNVCILFLGHNIKPTKENIAYLALVLVSKNKGLKLIKFLTKKNNYYYEEGIKFSTTNQDSVCSSANFTGNVSMPKTVTLNMKNPPLMRLLLVTLIVPLM